jgi:hypothetical protein
MLHGLYFASTPPVVLLPECPTTLPYAVSLLPRSRVISLSNTTAVLS